MVENENLATGRRKRAVAAVRLRKGTGNIRINGKMGLEYFKTDIQRADALAALSLLGVRDSYDILIRVRGGGLSGQSGAVKLGVARALAEGSESLRPMLREAGLLTRDPRRRERKKYGRPGARKKFQFSKR